jgi:hypothetical protein
VIKDAAGRYFASFGATRGRSIQVGAAHREEIYGLLL